MLDQASLPGIMTPEEDKKANFKLDTEGSFALLVITPIHAVSDEGEHDYILVDETIEIKPYPNPYGFGGLWGHGNPKPEEEENVIADFHHWVDPWIKRGLVRVEIKHEPGRTEHVPTEAQRQAALAQYRNRPAVSHKPKHQDNPMQQVLF